MINIQFYTIGVYGSSEEEFFQKLKDNNIDCFIDVRKRRAVRGSQYAFVNSRRLQDKLNAMSISYKHIIELAPTAQIREKQKQLDLQSNILKRDRQTLGAEFIEDYKAKVLKTYDLSLLIRQLEYDHLKNVVFFCVEKTPLACHRGIITSKLETDFSFYIKHL
ncbi:MAG: hypothetical protein JWN78_1965 [Bacteroidota bacterium]|nr:hypothetical protein [Bacteroidota bacterium]